MKSVFKKRDSDKSPSTPPARPGIISEPSVFKIGAAGDYGDEPKKKRSFMSRLFRKQKEEYKNNVEVALDLQMKDDSEVKEDEEVVDFLGMKVDEKIPEVKSAHGLLEEKKHHHHFKLPSFLTPHHHHHKKEEEKRISKEEEEASRVIARAFKQRKDLKEGRTLRLKLKEEQMNKTGDEGKQDETATEKEKEGVKVKKVEESKSWTKKLIPKIPVPHLFGHRSHAHLDIHDNPKLRSCISMIRLNEQLFWMTLASLLGNFLVAFFRLIFTGRGVSILEFSAALIFFVIISHRLLAYISGGILRYILRGDLISAGRWDIHFGWVSYRGFMDRNQLVLHNVIWLNPPSYNKTPFFLHIKEIVVSFSLLDIISFARFFKALRLEMVMVDGVELFIERSATSLNLWGAIGDDGDNRGFLKKTIQGVFSAFLDNIKSRLNPANLAKMFDFHKRVKEAEQVEFDFPTIELYRFLLFDMILHPLDLLSSKHVKTSSLSDILTPYMFIPHDEMLGKVVTPDGEKKKEPLRGDLFALKFGDAFTSGMLKDNYDNIAILLADSAANQSKHAITHIFHGLKLRKGKETGTNGEVGEEEEESAGAIVETPPSKTTFSSGMARLGSLGGQPKDKSNLVGKYPH